jgi:multisubunit Na+/H+ antiporter MnhE subunit
MTFDEGLKQSEKGYHKFIEGNDLMSEAVGHAFLYTWQWWLGIALFILPWILWLMIRKKESTGRLLVGGFVAIILSFVIDLIATSQGLWSYPLKFSPIAPQLFLPYHFSLTPVAIMLVLQIKPKANPLIKGSIFAAIAAFGGMNFFAMLKFYDPKGWSTIYDFIIFLCIFLVAYWFSNMDSFRKITEDR